MNELAGELRSLILRTSDPTPAYREIGLFLSSRVQENFRIGGNPPWPPSRRAMKQHGQTLLDTGRLMRDESMPEISRDGIRFGSNLPYAAIHHYGGEINMPARSELFIRNRYTTSGSAHRRGQFKSGTKEGRGFTRRAYTIRMPARPAIVFGQPDLETAAGIARSYFLGERS